MRGLPQKQNARRADKIKLCGHLRRYKKIVKKTYIILYKHISEYANKNEREFFAECFAEYLMSARPREAAKIFGEVLEKIMEGLR